METQTDYIRRLDAALAELDQAGITRANSTPPLFHLAKRLGLKPRTPHYMSFARAVLLTGPFFGLLWGLVMWIFVWSAQGLPAVVAVLASVLAGALFGLLMAGYYRRSSGNSELSRWEDL